jgi:putative hydroxymethylpyrimidine transport system substrate-binding protein
VTAPLRRGAVLAAALALAVVTTACGGSQQAGGSGNAPARLEVALDWFPNPDHVALYYALDRNLFSKEGVAVAFKTPSDPTAGLKLVATNKFDLAVYYESDLFFAAREGLPVVAVGALVPTPLNALISLAGSRVQGPGTVAGATIGVAGLPFDDAVLDTIRRTQGLAEDDVRSVNVGFDLVPALLAGQVDAVIGAYFNIEGTVLRLRTGNEPNVTRLEELGVPPYDELVIVANRDRLQEEPAYADSVRAFLAAMVEGIETARADERGALEIMEAQTEYTPAELEGMVPETLALLAPPGGRRTGCFDLDGWETFARWMQDTGLLESRVAARLVATNDYLPGCG